MSDELLELSEEELALDKEMQDADIEPVTTVEETTHVEEEVVEKTKEQEVSTEVSPTTEEEGETVGETKMVPLAALQEARTQNKDIKEQLGVLTEKVGTMANLKGQLDDMRANIAKKDEPEEIIPDPEEEPFEHQKYLHNKQEKRLDEQDRRLEDGELRDRQLQLVNNVRRLGNYNLFLQTFLFA